MPLNSKSPGVYIEENAKLPTAVVQVPTAIPAFIGYTELNTYKGLSLVNKPMRICSIEAYQEIFGFPQHTTLAITINNVSGINVLVGDVTIAPIIFRMHYALQLYFANGGGPCYITCIEKYGSAGGSSELKYAQMKKGLDAIRMEDEPSILLFPDAPVLAETEFYQIQVDALTQSADLMNRIVIVDVYTVTGTETFASQAINFRSGIGNNFLSYGAAYYPWLRTSLTPYINDANQPVKGGTIRPGSFLRLNEKTPGVDLTRSIYHVNNQLYAGIRASLEKNNIVLPPSSAVAGIYCQVDNSRGVWKTPANVDLLMVKEPMVTIGDKDQKDMNVAETGKSVNTIRFFVGKGILVWGARTLAGNDNEWRYISVRRFCIMVEVSLKKAISQFVVEPNDVNTWAIIKSMIENYLILQWRAGALMGTNPKDAFFVHTGLGETMTQADITEGRLIVEVGIAVLRPAEFNILRFSLKMG